MLIVSSITLIPLRLDTPYSYSYSYILHLSLPS